MDAEPRPANDEGAVHAAGSSDNEEVEESRDAPPEIEEIVKKRLMESEIEYLVKWRGMDSTHDSWVNEAELGDRYQHLVDDFASKNVAEEEKAEQEAEAGGNEDEPRGKKRPGEEIRATPGKKRRIDKSNAPSFDNGDKVQEIVGARMIDGILHLYVHWKGKNVCTFVKSEECNRRIPQKVIAFYEGRLKFEQPIRENGRVLSSSI